MPWNDHPPTKKRRKYKEMSKGIDLIVAYKSEVGSEFERRVYEDGGIVLRVEPQTALTQPHNMVDEVRIEGPGYVKCNRTAVVVCVSIT